MLFLLGVPRLAEDKDVQSNKSTVIGSKFTDLVSKYVVYSLIIFPHKLRFKEIFNTKKQIVTEMQFFYLITLFLIVDKKPCRVCFEFY